MKRKSTSLPARSAAIDRGVAVAGEGAAVVEGDGDGTAHGGPPRFGGAPDTWLCSQRYPTGEVGNQGLSRAGRPAGRSRPARGRGRRRRRRRTRGASGRTRGSPPTAAASANHSGVAGPPASSIAAVNADVAWPDGNELVIGPVHAVGERTLGRVVVRRADPAEARLDRPVGEQRLDAERGAEAQRDRRVAAPRGAQARRRAARAGCGRPRSTSRRTRGRAAGRGCARPARRPAGRTRAPARASAEATGRRCVAGGGSMVSRRGRAAAAASGSMTVPGPRSSSASTGSPPCAGQYGLNVQKSHRRPGCGRKSSRLHAVAIAVVQRGGAALDAA